MSRSSKYRPSQVDGLPCRVSGEWAKEKLHYLGGYMAIFNAAMKNLWPHRAFVDLMAGPGRCILEDGDEEFDGSPLRALKCDPPFTSVLLIESHSKLRAALSARIADYGTHVRVIGGDCNDPAIVKLVRETIPWLNGRLKVW